MVGDHPTLNLSLINSKDSLEYSTVETNDEYLKICLYNLTLIIMKLMTFINLPWKETKEAASVSYTLTFAP